MLLKRKYLFGTTILAGVMAASTAAMAQDAPVPDQDGATEVEEIVVTGSLIRRSPANSPTPLIQVGREQLLSTGQPTVIDYLAKIPALSNSVVPADTTGNNLNDGGLSLPNLRSLGTARTLTLVDGRRHVGSSAGSLAVDVDTVPRLLIENIEIVTGGASGIYGADAVSGVLNFILRKDFEGVEVDANYGQINQNGEATKRFSALVGKNFFDDRLNVYAHAEYEQIDEIKTLDIDWLEDANVLLGVDADPTTAGQVSDGIVDLALFSGVVRLDRPVWGQVTLAGVQRPSALNDPDVAFGTCTAVAAAACYSVDPTKTYYFDGRTARLANFGQRVGETGASRGFNIGGDGDNPSSFGQESRSPRSESQRYQIGSNFKITDSVNLYAEAKYITEDTFDIGQNTFFDVLMSDSLYAANTANPITGTAAFNLRVSDNAFIPDNLKAAIAANTVTSFGVPTATMPGQPTTTVSRQWARYSSFGPTREQDNTREIQRYVVGLNGDLDEVGFVKNIAWDLSYVYGKLENVNNERGVDYQRFALAADSVFDTNGVLGARGAVVCRSRLLAAQNIPLSTGPGNGLYDLQRSSRDGAVRDLRSSAEGAAAIAQCQPLNIFGVGNQSAEALAYVDASVNVRETNEQEQAVATVSGQLWDFFGAGPIGVALGAEMRREFTEGIGRTADTGDRFLFLNTGPDFQGAEYESEEYFAELSVPLFQDTYLGEYAELSGSYRKSDYTTVGDVEVYGANLVYRPIRDIAFKTSFNKSARVPNLAENFRPATQTFLLFTDPCTTLNIAAVANIETRANRVTNCTSLAADKGLRYDFAGATSTNVDDYVPVYVSSVAGVFAGNPFLKAEESESFTFSTVLRPRFIPNFSLVLDYYEVRITDVISAVSAQTAANNCVNGPSLNASACGTLFRNIAPVANPTSPQEASEAFKLGDLSGPFGGFIQGSINFAALETRGLDFTANYSWDFDEQMGRNWGALDYSLSGLWLIEQEQFLDSTNPSNFDTLAGGLEYPRVRFLSSLTYTPNDVVNFNWTVDWQSSQAIFGAQSPFRSRDLINNADQRPLDAINTGNFYTHDFTVKWNIREDLTMRFGVVNAFDKEPARFLQNTVYTSYDAYGTRFFVGLNFRPF